MIIHCRSASHVLVPLLFALASLARAQAIPPDKESLENSEGAGMAAYADVNGYPGPKHILEMQDMLMLTEEQRKDIQSIFEAMKESARAKGDAIIQKERQLESLFRTEKATEAEVKKMSSEIGRLRGELRAIHMVAHIQAKQVLIKDQTALYNSLRREMKQQKHTK
ncbi:MAG: hypothetical protein AAB393_16055 [Bacteroidota bacterium]